MRLLSWNSPAYRSPRKDVIDYTRRPRAEILRLVWIYRAIKMPVSGAYERVREYTRVYTRWCKIQCICERLRAATEATCWWKSRRGCTEGNRVAVV